MLGRATASWTRGRGRRRVSQGANRPYRQRVHAWAERPIGHETFLPPSPSRVHPGRACRVLVGAALAQRTTCRALARASDYLPGHAPPGRPTRGRVRGRGGVPARVRRVRRGVPPACTAAQGGRRPSTRSSRCSAASTLDRLARRAAAADARQRDMVSYALRRADEFTTAREWSRSATGSTPHRSSRRPACRCAPWDPSPEPEPDLTANPNPNPDPDPDADPDSDP